MKGNDWTEEDWLTFTTQHHGFIWEANCLWPIVTERKCQLFAVACCRRIWRYIPDEESRQVIDRLELLADGLLTQTDFDATWRERVQSGVPSQSEGYGSSVVATCYFDKETRLADTAASYCRAAVGGNAPYGEGGKLQAEEEKVQCDLIRDLFGNPFRPVTFNPAWRTSDVLLLAQGIYDERAFDRMPILADALQDAGCDSDDILGHLRDTTATHVRGCWALDLVLGKV